jgi:hypothetical protein
MAENLIWYGLVRTYHLGELARSRAFTQLTPEISRWADRRARDDMGMCIVAPIDATFRTHELRFERVLIANTVSGYVDVVLHSSSPDLPVALLESNWELLTEEEELTSLGEPVTVQQLWDRTVLDFDATISVDTLPKTLFGSVAFMRPEAYRVTQIEGEPADVRVALRHRGIAKGEIVHLERNSLLVETLIDDPLADRQWGYALLAGLCSRSRLISDEIVKRSSALVKAINGESGRWSAEPILTKAAEIQQFGIESRAWSQAASYLGNPCLVRIFNNASEDAALGAVDRENQMAALEGLDRFASGLSGAAIARSQRRLNTVGFIVALISVLMASINVVFLVNASSHQREDVYLSAALIIVAIGSALAATLLWRRRSP